MQKERVIYSIRETVGKMLPLGAKVVLFGSQARGDAREDSDWDILILLDKDRINNTDFDDVAYPLIELGWKMGVMINPILYTYGDWHKRNFTLFYKNVEQEGIVLCH
jgi:predicted nucleotidyltransferase